MLSPVEDIVSVDSADEWERTLREAIEYYLNEPKLLANVNMMQHLAAEVWWDLSLPTLVGARATFIAQFDSCLHAHSMREELFKPRKIEKRVVTFLVGLLRRIIRRAPRHGSARAPLHQHGVSLLLLPEGGGQGLPGVPLRKQCTGFPVSGCAVSWARAHVCFGGRGRCRWPRLSSTTSLAVLALWWPSLES